MQPGSKVSTFPAPAPFGHPPTKPEAGTVVRKDLDDWYMVEFESDGRIERVHKSRIYEIPTVIIPA